jgi:hypothetical protein
MIEKVRVTAMESSIGIDEIWEFAPL